MNKEARKLLSHNSFRFRYVSRGEEANALACLSVRALRWCHPKIRILIIDANDTASIAPEDLPGAQVIHLPPADDAVSAHVGRGTPHHLFYWRHSPQVLAALPGGGCFDVYIDCDIIPLRPMPLGELAGPLQRGRIAAAVDEDTPLFLHAYESKAFAISRIATGFREIGPLIQSGLVFSNPLNDGGMYRSLWKMAEAVAEAGLLKDLPYDDMSLFTVLMSQGGALWERFLPLGHHWNFITDSGKDPGLYAIGAHFGGRRAKAFLRKNLQQFMAPDNETDAWGNVALARPDAKRRFQNGLIRGRRANGEIIYELRGPFAISWKQTKKQLGEIRVRFEERATGSLVVLLDSQCLERADIDSHGCVCARGTSKRAGIVTVISELKEVDAFSVARLCRK